MILRNVSLLFLAVIKILWLQKHHSVTIIHRESIAMHASEGVSSDDRVGQMGTCRERQGAEAGK